MTSGPEVLAVVASPHGGGSTRAAAEAVLVGAGKAGATTRLADLADEGLEVAVDAIEAADAVVFGSPVYRSSHTALLESLLEQVQRGIGRETRSPLRATPTAIVMTGASESHFLASEHLRSILSSFFATQVLSPSLYLPASAFTEDKQLRQDQQSTAEHHGRALCELAAALSTSEALQQLRPLV